MNIIVTRPAKDKIRDVSKENNIKPQIRVYVEKATHCRAKYDLAFDSPNHEDEVTQIEDIEFITDRNIVPQFAKALLIDYVTKPSEGFIIEAYIPAKEGCGQSCNHDCNSCGGCGSK